MNCNFNHPNNIQTTKYIFWNIIYNYYSFIVPFVHAEYVPYFRMKVREVVSLTT
jgi:hypothetical protein